jgi:hypothetical protein
MSEKKNPPIKPELIKEISNTVRASLEAFEGLFTIEDVKDEYGHPRHSMAGCTSATAFVALAASYCDFSSRHPVIPA